MFKNELTIATELYKTWDIYRDNDRPSLNKGHM